MKKIISIVILSIYLISCDDSIKNGDLVYLSLRDGNHLSLNSNNGFKCEDERKLPLIFIDKKEGNYVLKTEDGRGVVLDKYFLYVKESDPTILKLDTLGNKVFIVSTNNRYFGCNGKEVYETYEPYIYLNKL